MNIFRSGVGLLFIAGCGLPATQSDIKMVGVGLDPDDIGTAPTYNGGLVEYNLVDFAGAQLPLGLMGFLSYSQLGPQGAFSPPYKLVVGKGYIFQDDALAPDSTIGTLAKPPDALGACQTRYEPRSYVGGLVDAGVAIKFRTSDGTGGTNIVRSPYIWPTDVRDVNAYYVNVDTWRPAATKRKSRLSDDDYNPSEMVSTTHHLANFPEGQHVEMDFPGGVPPIELNMGSIPLPLRSVGGNRSVVLPRSPQGVRLSWDGPRYDQHGLAIAPGHPEFLINMFDSEHEANSGIEQEKWVRVEDGYASCLQYLPHSTMPADSDACLKLQEAPTTPDEFDALGLDFDKWELNGQMYTGPWETADQQVVFDWVPEDANSREKLTLTVRFLGPVDRQNQYMGSPVVDGTSPSQSHTDALDWPESVQESWEKGIEEGLIPEGTSLPEPDRAAMACDDDRSGDVDDAGKLVTWKFDRQYADEDGSTIPSLQGDPAHILSEVNCRLDDLSGRFVLTQSMLDKAMDYATMHGAEGAVFYLTRSTETDVQAPPVRDRYGKRHDTSPIKVVSRAMQVGRFWYEQ